MSKRTYQEIRLAILEALHDGKEHSFGDLERRVNTNWITIRNQCKDMMIFRVVTISDNKVCITKEGREILHRLQKE